MSASKAEPARINPAQAVFGMLWSVWYGKVTADILSATSVALPSLPVELVQILYILSSPIWLAVLVSMLLRAQRTTSAYPDVRNKDFVTGLKQTRDLASHILSPMLLLWGFLATTYFLFPGNLDPLLVLFGAWHPLIWVVFELWLVMAK